MHCAAIPAGPHGTESTWQRQCTSPRQQSVHQQTHHGWLWPLFQEGALWTHTPCSIIETLRHPEDTDLFLFSFRVGGAKCVLCLCWVFLKELVRVQFEIFWIINLCISLSPVFSPSYLLNITFLCCNLFVDYYYIVCFVCLFHFMCSFVYWLPHFLFDNKQFQLHVLRLHVLSQHMPTTC